MHATSEFWGFQPNQQSDAMPATLVNFVDAGVGPVVEHVQAAPGNLSSTFAITFFEQFFDATNTFMGRFDVRGNAPIGKFVDGVDAAFRHTFWIKRVWRYVGCLGRGHLLAGEHGEHCQCRESKSFVGHHLPLFVQAV